MEVWDCMPSDKGGLQYIRIVTYCPVYAIVSNLKAGSVPHSSPDSQSTDSNETDGSKTLGVPRGKVTLTTASHSGYSCGV